MVAVGSGLAAQFVATDEVTFGVAPSLAAARSYEMKSETMELKKTAVTGEGLAAGKVYQRTKRRVQTVYDSNGTVSLDLPTRQMAFWARHMVGSFGYTLVTPTQIASSGVYKSVHWPGPLGGKSFVMQKGVPATDATVEPFTYVGCKLASWEIACSVGAIASLTLNIDARNELAGAGNGDPLNGSVPGLAAFAVPVTGLGESVFHFKQATLFTGGTPTVAANIVSLVGTSAAGNIKDVTIQHSLALDNNRYFVGSGAFKGEQIENGYRHIGGSFVIEWLSSEAMYNAYAADTTTSLQLTFTGATVSTSNYLFDIIIPNIKLDGESPKVGGPQVVTESCQFTGLDDESTTPIQILYQSEDSAI
jgi:hypothetical protein